MREALAGGVDPSVVAAAHPTGQLAWAVLAERALAEGRPVEGYAYARTGYHRGLDALRRGGWKGQGPVPWAHEPNQGFLRALSALGRAAAAIGESDEADRCAQFLRRTPARPRRPSSPAPSRDHRSHSATSHQSGLGAARASRP